MAVESFTADNLVTATKKLITQNIYQLESGESVVRGEVLKKGTTGLVALASDTDTPYAISLQTVDASAEAKDLSYAIEGSFNESSLIYGASGSTIANYRDKFVSLTRLVIEE